MKDASISKNAAITTCRRGGDRWRKCCGADSLWREGRTRKKASRLRQPQSLARLGLLLLSSVLFTYHRRPAQTVRQAQPRAPQTRRRAQAAAASMGLAALTVLCRTEPGPGVAAWV